MLNKHDERVLFQKAKSKHNMTEMEQNTFSSIREQHLVKKEIKLHFKFRWKLSKGKSSIITEMILKIQNVTTAIKSASIYKQPQQLGRQQPRT